MHKKSKQVGKESRIAGCTLRLNVRRAKKQGRYTEK